MQDLTDFFKQYGGDSFELRLDAEDIYLRADGGDKWLTLSDESQKALAKDISWFLRRAESVTDGEKTLA